MKTQPILTLFGGTFGTLKFNANSFFSTLLGFTSYWDYKPTNAYTSEKILNIGTKNNIQLVREVIDG